MFFKVLKLFLELRSTYSYPQRAKNVRFLLHFRVFQDSQLQMIQEIMTQVYNMGAVVEECEVIMEFKRSGREGSVLPTDICNMTQVQDVSLQ